MLVFKTVVTFTSRNLINSMASLACFILPLSLLAGCANEGTEGPLTSPTHTPQSSVAQADDGEDPEVAMTSTPTGVIAHLAWDPPDDFNVAGYNIYYGKRSPEKLSSDDSSSDEPEPNVCSYGESRAVEDPHATITGLEPDTEYLFAIQAFNKTDSLCSNEITVVTPARQS